MFDNERCRTLKILPQTLKDGYGEIDSRIRKQSRRASQLALNAFRWVQCSYEPLRSETLLDAVKVETNGVRHAALVDSAHAASQILDETWDMHVDTRIVGPNRCKPEVREMDQPTGRVPDTLTG